MAYTKQNWSTGDLITAEKLNHMEDGINEAQGSGGTSTPGEDGGYYTPSVDVAGNLSWTASKADMPAVAGANIKGPKGDTGNTGPTGPAGADGATPNLQIGAVETLDAGSDATASITGTAENPLLNLGIPKGVDGAGGGGDEEWELIADVTTAELVVSVFINADLGGQPFALKKAILSLETKTERIDEVSYTGAKRVSIDVNGTSAFYGNTLLSSADSVRPSRAFIEVQNGELFGEAIALLGINSGVIRSPVVTRIEAETINSVKFSTDYISVTGIGIVTRFSIGSKFKLWGVRA